MASPFSIFRKHQRVMLAGVTILAMIGFVFMGPFTRSGNGPGGGARGAEKATWKFGTIYDSDLGNVRHNRNLVNAFFAAANKELEAKGKPPETLRAPRYPIDDGSLLQAIVLHKKAEQMGVVINDTAVNDRIDAFTQNALSGEEKARVAASVPTGEGTHLTARQLVDNLRFEMELETLAALIGSDANEISTPQQRWDYFCRLNRKATVEVLPVPVKDFVDKVKATPSNDELKSFFELYKNNFSSPDSPTPGFKEPVRGKFQYFVAKDDELIKEEKPKVTDDEIKQYYEKNKEQFKKSDDEGAVSPDKTKPAATNAPDSKATPDAGKAGDKTEKSSKDEKQPAETKPGDANPGDSKPADAKPADTKPTDAKPGDAKPSDSKATDGKSSDLNSADPKSSNAKPAGTKPLDGKPSPDNSSPPGKSSLLEKHKGRVVQDELLALADDAAPKPAAPAVSDKPAPSTPAANDDAGKKDESAKKDQTAPTTDKTPAEKTPSPPADAQKTSPEKSATSTAEPDKTQPVKTPATKDGLPDLGLKPSEPPKKIPVVEYRSLTDEAVRDEIRASIAKQKVRDRVEAAFKDLQTKISTYKRKFDAWNGRKVGNAPPPPDFVELAKQNRLKFEDTGLITPADAQELLLGKSYSFVPDSLARVSFLQAAFNPTLGNYRPESTGTNQFEWLFDLKPEATETASFLWWRVDYKDAYVPEFDKVKGQVLDVWKMVEARKLAKAQAKEYADEANKKKARLDEAFTAQPNVHVSTAKSFSWMRQTATALDPTRRTPPILSEVPGVDKPGEDFMRTVFRLEPGSTGVAMNQPETVAYAVQLINFDPSEQELHRKFMSDMAVVQQDAYRSLDAMYEDNNRAEFAKLQAIFKEYDVKSVAQPNASAVASSNVPTGPADEGDE